MTEAFVKKKKIVFTITVSICITRRHHHRVYRIYRHSVNSQFRNKTLPFSFESKLFFYFNSITML